MVTDLICSKSVKYVASHWLRQSKLPPTEETPSATKAQRNRLFVRRLHNLGLMLAVGDVARRTSRLDDSVLPSRSGLDYLALLFGMVSAKQGLDRLVYFELTIVCQGLKSECKWEGWDRSPYALVVCVGYAERNEGAGMGGWNGRGGKGGAKRQWRERVARAQAQPRQVATPSP